MRTSRQVPKSPSGRRMAIAYTLLAALALAVVLAVLQAGAQRRPARQVPAGQRVAQATLCLGPAGTELRLEQSGRFLTLDGPDRLAGRLRLDGDRLHGQVACRDGGSAALDVVLDGGGLRGTVGGAELATTATAGQVGGGGAAARPAVPRSAEEAFGQLMLAVAVVILAARLVGAAVRRVGQPPVMGEVLAGILLGPTLLGTVAPGVSAFVFPEWVVPYLRAGADIGLAFYMFLVGLELDPALLRGRVQQAALISHASIALPITLGVAVALPLFGLVGPPTSFVPFALFMGVAMSITAFPVLARILLERRMLKHPVGAIAMGAAAVDDVTAWGLLALASAVAGSGSAFTVVRVIALAALFCAVMLLVVRRLLARVSDAYDEAGHVPGGWIATIFVGVLLSSFVTQRIGIAAIFGAFVMGLAMPRRADLHPAGRGLRGDRAAAAVLRGHRPTGAGWPARPAGAVAARPGPAGRGDRRQVAGRGGRGALHRLHAARVGRHRGADEHPRADRADRALHRPGAGRGDAGAVHHAGADGAGDDVHGRAAAAPDRPARDARRPAGGGAGRGPAGHARAGQGARPQRARRPTGRQEPGLADRPGTAARPRPAAARRGAGPAAGASPVITGLAAENRELARAAAKLHRRRDQLVAEGLTARAVTFTTADPGHDLVRLAAEQEVDLVLLEPGREGVLRAAAGAGLLVVGLSERWRAEGLGPTRSRIARAAPAPTLFVRRGTRRGALAPRDDLTRC